MRRRGATAEASPVAPLTRPVPLAQQAHEWIRRQLLTGAFSPTDRLTEEDLAGRLSMSRTPVREALHRLALTGTIDPAPGGGYVRRRATQRDIREHCELRRLLEPHAAALAAERGRVEYAPEALDPRRLDAAGNAAFHGAVADAADSEVLAALVRTLNERVELHRIYAEGDLEQLASQHREIVAAIERRDPRAAFAARTEHLAFVERWLLDAAWEGGL